MWVADFGLARIKDGDSHTKTGDMVGTLRYLSPERLDRGSAIIDERSDIYSLGVTLYELLTLRAPFESEERAKLIPQILRQEPPAPRHWNPAIPTDLETIVLKAMAKQPEERYRSARELAEEFDRFLEHQPIRARPPSAWNRCVKWSRRNRPLLAGIVLTLVTSWALSMLLLWQAYAEARQQEQRVRHKLGAALQLLEEFLKLASGPMAREPSMQRPLRDLFTAINQSYDDLLRDELQLSEQDRHRMGVAAYLGGNVYARFHEQDRQEQSYRKAIAIIEALARDFPENPQYRFDLFHTYKMLGHRLTSCNRDQECTEAARTSYAYIEELARQYPNNANYQEA